ncbi:fused DSP-PTPase phosphatase/NAD kinase-like protein [Primorskyibacter sp. S187A]|uniref:phosphatase domain-containing protein n=1 Tax=Primorskyibacter sp. S187A TaxID=3415130 RepID=UPI003C7D85CC
MSEKSNSSLSRFERRVRKSFGRGDRSTWHGRLLAQLNYLFMDHAILRIFWTNFYEVSPGVYRSNQPTHSRFRRYRDMGVKSVLNLRGEENYPHFHLARESCEQLGMDMQISKLWARNAPKRERILAVLDKLRTMERPLLFHCKSGADRAGFVAAMYMMVFDGKSVAEARKMLSLRFVHLKWTKTGVQDYILDVFEARQSLGEISFENWLRQEYRGSWLQSGWNDKTPPREQATRLLEKAQSL